MLEKVEAAWKVENKSLFNLTWDQRRKSERKHKHCENSSQLTIKHLFRSFSSSSLVALLFKILKMGKILIQFSSYTNNEITRKSPEKSEEK